MQALSRPGDFITGVDRLGLSRNHSGGINRRMVPWGMVKTDRPRAALTTFLSVPRRLATFHVLPNTTDGTWAEWFNLRPCWLCLLLKLSVALHR